MTPYTPADTFHSNISNFDISDLVLGGATGPDNIPVKELADNGLWLFNRLGRFDGVHVLNAGNQATLIDRSVRLKLIYVDGAGNLTFTMDTVANFQDGDVFHFKVKNSANKSVTFLFSGGQSANDGTTAYTKICCHDGDEFKFIIYNGSFIFCPVRGNWDVVGQDRLVRVVPKNAFIGQGQLVNRLDYARIWEFANVNGLVISDATWNASVANMGHFSSGNGTTTFRVPDMRAMMHRALDLGRGVRLGNTGSDPGNFEPDKVGPHTHTTNIPQTNHSTFGQTPIGVTDGAYLGAGASGIAYSSSQPVGGGSETSVKNIGLIPVIYY
jgi:microcystin-dependent protein